MKNTEDYELETYRIVWYAEQGYTDGNGMGHWESTVDSVPFKTRHRAEMYFAELLADGKLKLMPWGKLRPLWPYGITQIRKAMERVDK